MDTAPYTIEELDLPGVLLFTPKRREDARGFSALAYDQALLADFGITTRFVEDNVSYSKYGVLRGLHFQRAPHTQDKLVRCSSGRIFDVAADCDPTSATYGRHVAVELRGERQQFLFIPGAYAHAFCVLSDGAVVEYKLSAHYHAESVGGARFDDPALAIKWPIEEPILSEADTRWPALPHG